MESGVKIAYHGLLKTDEFESNNVSDSFRKGSV